MEEKPAAVSVDQRNLTSMLSIAYIAAKVENEWRESVVKLVQAHGLSSIMVHDTLHKDLQFSKKSAR